MIDARGKTKGGRPILGATLQDCLSIALEWLATKSDTAVGRIGFVGCGLGGDAVLWAAETDTRIAAALGISPMLETSLVPDVTMAGTDWLRELSYRQVWLWRRRWSAIQQTASDLALNAPRHYGTSATRAVLVGCEPRTALIGAWNGAKVLSTSIGKQFSLLGDDHARALVVNWLRRELGTIQDS